MHARSMQFFPFFWNQSGVLVTTGAPRCIYGEEICALPSQTVLLLTEVPVPEMYAYANKPAQSNASFPPRGALLFVAVRCSSVRLY